MTIYFRPTVRCSVSIRTRKSVFPTIMIGIVINFHSNQWFKKLLYISATLANYIAYFHFVSEMKTHKFGNKVGPRHTTNPSTLRKFWVQKISYKKLMNFFEKIYWHFKTTLHLFPKHLRRHYPLKMRPDFDSKELEFFDFRK